MTDTDRAASTLARVAAAHRALEADLWAQTLDVRAPSRLPGWSVGHVLTHLARNADSVVRRLEASHAGMVVEQYEGGLEGRATQIEAGAQRPYAVQREDVIQTAAAIERLVPTLSPSTWSFETVASSGELQPGLVVLARRELEVVLHHTDLGRGFEPASWPQPLVDELVDEGLDLLSARADPSALAGWFTDRAEPPPLRSWTPPARPGPQRT